MGTAERRQKMLMLLCRRRHETVAELASLLGVSRRTVLRDVEVLSLSVPIYTRKGRFGGIYLMDGYSADRMYMKADELALLNRLLLMAESAPDALSDDDLQRLSSMIARYTPPETSDFCGKNCKTG